MSYLESAVASDTTKELTLLNVDFRNPEERARFNEQQEALFASRKRAIVSDLRKKGILDDQGNWHFNEPLPADMQADSKADFNH